MRQIFTLLGIVAMGATAYGQADTDFVYIPDALFKRYLVENTAINTNKDKDISYGEARAYTGKIDIADRTTNYIYRSIYSLKGIEAFTNITELDCTNQKITNIDVSKNTALEILNCYSNQLTSLDVSKNIALQELNCSSNQLRNLDVSKNVALKRLVCGSNKFSSLDVSKNTVLQYLACSMTDIESLDLSKNTALEEIYFGFTHELKQLNLANGNNHLLKRVNLDRNFIRCVQIDKGFTVPERGWVNTTGVKFSDNCNYPTLSTTEVAAEQAIQILNPVKDNLIIKTTAKVERVEIYNTAGQLVKVLFKGNTQVQDLVKGVYIVKITTDKGIITQKIIKQ